MPFGGVDCHETCELDKALGGASERLAKAVRFTPFYDSWQRRNAVNDNDLTRIYQRLYF